MNRIDTQQMGTPGALDMDALYRQCRGQMMSVARRIVHNEADAEDVVQQAFLNGLAHVHAFEGRAQISSWMYRITTNTALMHLRSRRRKGADSLDALPEPIAEARITSAATSAPARPDERVALNEIGSFIRDAATVLPSLDRDIIEMRLADGYSTEEVAKETGLTTGAIKSRLHRARRVLQDQLDVLRCSAVAA